MKENSVFEKLMHFLIHNSFLVTVSVMGLVHATLLAIVILAGVTPLISMNILSVVVYLFCIVLAKFGHMLPVYLSLIVEVTSYAIVSTYYTGWECGSWCFLFSIVPIIIYFGAFLFKGNQRWFIVLMLVVNFAVYVAMYLRFDGEEALFRVTPLIRDILILFSSFMMVFATIFYSMIYIYASEMEKTSLEKKNEKLTADAKEDALTNLLNRRGFLPLIGSYMEGDRSYSHFCIAFCDIDNFKRINDSYGHDCGDEVLRHITKMIKKEMQGCSICRWGGEEIIILMKDYDMEVAKVKMEYLRKCVETNPTVFFNKRINATITIGLEESREIYNDPEEIIKVADERMYYGKQHGKNILIYEDMGA